jgi:hypothetical protein
MGPQKERNRGSQGGAESETYGRPRGSGCQQRGGFGQAGHQQYLELLGGGRHGHGRLGIPGNVLRALEATAGRAPVAATAGLLNRCGVEG